MTRFFVEGVPRPGGSKKAFHHRTTGKIVVVDMSGKGGRDWRKAVQQAARIAYRGEPAAGPLRLDVTFEIPRPKSHYRAAGLLKADAPNHPLGPPDRTKLLRAVEDACTGILWIDDRLILAGETIKRYAIAGLIGVAVEVTRIT